jgi:hypothetical protein
MAMQSRCIDCRYEVQRANSRCPECGADLNWQVLPAGASALSFVRRVRLTLFAVSIVSLACCLLALIGDVKAVSYDSFYTYMVHRDGLWNRYAYDMREAGMGLNGASLWPDSRPDSPDAQTVKQRLVPFRVRAALPVIVASGISLACCGLLIIRWRRFTLNAVDLVTVGISVVCMIASLGFRAYAVMRIEV